MIFPWKNVTVKIESVLSNKAFFFYNLKRKIITQNSLNLNSKAALKLIVDNVQLVGALIEIESILESAPVLYSNYVMSQLGIELL